MKKLFAVAGVLLSSFLLSGCSLKKAPAALQINTIPAANVFVDGKPMGKTPYYGADFKAGEVEVKLIPESTTTALVSWEGKVKLIGGVLTLIDREFTASEDASSGQILTLEKIKDKKSASLSVITEPDGSLIKVNGEAKGFAPLALEKLNEGDHEIIISKEGYTEKKIRAKAALGYRLIVNAKLALSGGETVSLTPTPSAKATPRATDTQMEKPYIQVKDTPTGWLRVRMEPSVSATEAAKINPGEKYPLLDEKSGWYKIRYSGTKEGWVSGQYATKYE